MEFSLLFLPMVNPALKIIIFTQYDHLQKKPFSSPNSGHILPWNSEPNTPRSRSEVPMEIKGSYVFDGVLNSVPPMEIVGFNSAEIVI